MFQRENYKIKHQQFDYRKSERDSLSEFIAQLLIKTTQQEIQCEELLKKTKDLNVSFPYSGRGYK